MRRSHIFIVILVVAGGALAFQTQDTNELTQKFTDFAGDSVAAANSCPKTSELKTVIEKAEIVDGQAIGGTGKYLKWQNWQEMDDYQEQQVGEAGNWTVFGKQGRPQEAEFGYERGYYLELDCHQGNKEGENVNYQYCEIGSELMNSGLKMRKTVVSENGEIQEKNTVTVEKAVYNSNNEIQELTCN